MNLIHVARFTESYVDTTLASDIYALSDERNWRDLHKAMLKAGADFTVDSPEAV